ncbi:unnamed protein product [Acanthoscelides obtectus]|uniref:Transmembrane protein n=1 Tax=Acanthoscelides obtectus TaxID=200917 RepID=A0A9P0L6J2_ACAOB|nr:unnamed protein product [Acanthoscelides obtectus]CAK1626838.1 hypothetical protein AOBTE_LOCUS4106 [Acanthoscelides obtectus]
MFAYLHPRLVAYRKLYLLFSARSCRIAAKQFPMFVYCCLNIVVRSDTTTYVVLFIQDSTIFSLASTEIGDAILSYTSPATGITMSLSSSSGTYTSLAGLHFPKCFLQFPHDRQRRIERKRERWKQAPEETSRTNKPSNNWRAFRYREKNRRCCSMMQPVSKHKQTRTPAVSKTIMIPYLIIIMFLGITYTKLFYNKHKVLEEVLTCSWVYMGSPDSIRERLIFRHSVHDINVRYLKKINYAAS